MTRVFFAYPANRRKLFNSVSKKLTPDNALYGLNHMHLYGINAQFKDVSSKLEKLLDFLFLPLHKLFFSQIDFDFKLGRALLLLPWLNKADCIVANTDGIALAICLLKRLRLVNKPLIYAVGLFYIQGNLKAAIDNEKKSLFFHFYQWLLGAADQILFHAQIEKDKLVKMGVYNPAVCTFVPMGSDSAFFNLNKFQKLKKLENIVVSVGKDRARDYKTLLECAKKIPYISFKLVCRKINIAGLNIPNNVKVYFDLPYIEVAKLYKQASLIVIPIREMHRSSGQMTLTDCIQCSKPIIISDVVGVSHYPLKNNVNVIKVAPENPQLLKNAILKLLKNNQLRTKLIRNTKTLAVRYSTKNYARSVAKTIKFTTDDLRLKPIKKPDLEFMRNLRNQNRNFFIHSDAISTSEKQAGWFEEYTKKHDDYTFILTKNDTKIGIGAIYNINEKKRNAEIGRFIIDQKFQGHGHGKILLKKIEELAFSRLGLESLYLEVLTGNKTAVNFYKKTGFIKQKDILVNGKKVTFMIKKKES